jgi:hypothetical protein
MTEVRAYRVSGGYLFVHPHTKGWNGRIVRADRVNRVLRAVKERARRRRGALEEEAYSDGQFRSLERAARLAAESAELVNRLAGVIQCAHNCYGTTHEGQNCDCVECCPIYCDHCGRML